MRVENKTHRDRKKMERRIEKAGGVQRGKLTDICGRECNIITSSLTVSKLSY